MDNTGMVSAQLTLPHIIGTNKIMISLKFVENWTLTLIALLMSGGILQLLCASPYDAITGDPRMQLMFAVSYGIVLIIAILHYRQTRWSIRSSPALFGLLLLACMSASWSESPALVLRRSIAIVGTSMFGVVLVTHLKIKEQLNLLRKVFRLCAVLSVGCITLAPQYGIDVGYQAGDWRGLFEQKNDLGAAMATALLVELCLTTATPKTKMLKIAWLSLEALLLAYSKSATAIIALIMSLTVLWASRTLRWRFRVRYRFIFMLFLFSAVLLVALPIDTGSVTAAVGKSATLTGRTPLWKFVVEMISRRPLLGYGYSGFWHNASSESGLVSSTLDAYYSHNGYLEIFLSLGIAGLGLVVLFFWGGLKQAIVLAESRRSAQCLWPLAFLVYILLHNIAECSIMWQNSLEWAICVAVVIGPLPELNRAADTSNSYQVLSCGSAKDHISV